MKSFSAPPPLIFRQDLDESVQNTTIDAFRRMRSDDLNFAEWKKTMMMRRDHRIFVFLLVGEAIRYNPGRFTGAEKKAIAQRLTSLMSPERHNGDKYVEALHYLSELHMFTR